MPQSGVPSIAMNITILSNEYPPHVYGGAGVHVEYLTRELAALDDREHRVEVFCFGDQQVRQGNLTADGVTAPGAVPSQDPRHQRFLDTLLRDLAMTGRPTASDVVHCHTWYSHFAGCLVKQLYDVPLVLTTHSLEPHRPWKVEQLGTAYQASTWIEQTAYQNADGVVAVSQAMRRDVHELYNVPWDNIHVIHNGIDLRQYKPTLSPETLVRFGIDPDTPFVLFVGRITRQKGIIHLVRAIEHMQPGVQVVLCAGPPDTPEIGMEMTEAVERARTLSTHRIVWIREMLPKDQVITLYTHAISQSSEKVRWALDTAGIPYRERLLTPFVILFSLPLAMIGAIVALVITGSPLSISAMIGILMLVGIVVTNAIVMLEFVIMLQHERGHSTREALIEGATTRLRPILMTAIAAMLALIPLSLGLTEGALIASDLGRVVIGGLFSSTLLTLLVVPVVYSLADGIRRRAGRRRAGRQPAEREPVPAGR